MDDKFLREVIEMSDEAMEALGSFERLGGGDGQVFATIRSVGVACLDGQNVKPSILDRLPARAHYEFSQAVFLVASLSSLSGGAGNNIPVRAGLKTIKKHCPSVLAQPESNKRTTDFYSWQARLPNKTNRGLIEDALERAIKEINRDLSVQSRVSIDSDTKGEPGSPDIINTILKKIDECSIFIADVSLVDGNQPNANVMFELGYAMKALGDGRILMVFNEAYGATKDLPFDLGFKRQIIYACGADDNEKSQVRQQLAQKLKVAISSVHLTDKTDR